LLVRSPDTMAVPRSLPVAFLLALCCSLGVLVVEPAAQAHGPRPGRPPAVVKPAVSVSLQTDHGHRLTSVRHRGQTFVAGEQGERYEIVVTNNTASRVEVVVSVDGRDAVSGQLGDFTSQRGYVLDPFGTVVVDGFRTSLEQVAAFRFSSVADSFSGRLGTPQHAGVIGVAVFKEQPHRRVAHAKPEPQASAPGHSGGTSTLDSSQRSDKDSKAPSSARRSRAEARNELGTEFGEQRHSAVREVSFVRASARRPDFSTQIRYDSARGLAARGVPIEVEPVIVHHHAEPDAWPAASSSDRFAQPPPGWRRR
jgi:hypothetical protein